MRSEYLYWLCERLEGLKSVYKAQGNTEEWPRLTTDYGDLRIPEGYFVWKFKGYDLPNLRSDYNTIYLQRKIQ